MRLSLALLGAVFAIASAGSAAAQPAPWEPERLTAGWVFTPGVTLGTMWDSNATLVNEGDPRVSTWLTIFNPRGELTFNGRRTHFNVGYSGALEAFRHESELNRYEQRARGELRHRLSERLQLNASTDVSVSPTTDRLARGAVGLPFVQVGTRAINAEAGFAIDLSSRTHVDAEYHVTHMRFDDVVDAEVNGLGNLNGGVAQSPSVSVQRELTSRLSAGANWSYHRARINAATDIVNGDAGIFHVNTALAGVVYQIGEYTKLSGGAGVSYLRQSSPPLSSTGPALRGSLEHQVGRDTTVGVHYAREFVPTFSFGGVNPNQNIGANARVNLLQTRAWVSGGVSYNRTDPDEQRGVAFAVDSVMVDTAFGYQFLRWLRAEVFYYGAFQTTSVQGNVDRNRIGVQFVTFKPMRIQ